MRCSYTGSFFVIHCMWSCPLRWTVSRLLSLIGIGEPKAPPTQALLKHPVLFLEILDHVQRVTIDPAGEHHEHHFERRKRGGRRVIISAIHRHAPSDACDAS